MKLKKKTIIQKLERIRLPQSTSLAEFTSFYEGLKRKYGSSKSLRLGRLGGGYYTTGANWLYENRLETNEELAVRQAKHDRELARRKAETERYRAARKKETLKRRAEMKQRVAAQKKAELEKKVEEVKTMVNILKMAGYTVAKGAATRS